MSLEASPAGVLHLMQSHKYEEAEEMIHLLLDEGEDDLNLNALLARAQLAQGKFEEALHNYNYLLHNSEESSFALGLEASLALDKTGNALQFCRLGSAENENNPEFHFLAALAHYKHGEIKSTRADLLRAIQFGFEWDDEDPLDFVAQQLLPVREFHDFEQLYLDCLERKSQDSNSARNRWFSLNMPTWDLLKASEIDHKIKRAHELADILSPHFDDLFLSNGKSELGRIINDMDKNKDNEAFVEKTRNTIRENNFIETAKLVLALELEHLRHFTLFFGLAENDVNESNFQSLLEMLPMRIAVGLIFLYSASRPDEKLPGYDPAKLSDDLFAGLIAACFVSFYQQVDAFRPQEGG